MSFPAHPYLGQVVCDSRGTWRYTGQVWVKLSSTGPVRVRTHDHPHTPAPQETETDIERELRHLRNRVMELEEQLEQSFLLID